MLIHNRSHEHLKFSADRFSVISIESINKQLLDMGITKLNAIIGVVIKLMDNMATCNKSSDKQVFFSPCIYSR